MARLRSRRAAAGRRRTGTSARARCRSRCRRPRSRSREPRPAARSCRSRPARARTRSRHARARRAAWRARLRARAEKSGEFSRGRAGRCLQRVSTYSVVVALHIIAAFAAYGLPLAVSAAPAVPAPPPSGGAAGRARDPVPAQRATSPARSRSCCSASASIWRATGAAGSEPFVAIGVVAIAIIAVVGGGVIVPATKAAGRAGARLGRVRPGLSPLPDRRDLPRRGGADRDLRNGGQTVLINGRVGHADQPRPAADRDRGAHADRPALKLDDTVVNYAVLNEGATRIAGLLKEKGLEPGDRVGIMLPNVPYFGVVYYGILRAGGVVVPMNVLLKGREVASTSRTRARRSCSPGTTSARPRRPAPRRPDRGDPGQAGRVRAAGDERAAAPEDDEPREGDDTAVILYTSGTTGTPKGAELTHDNLRENCTMTARTLSRSPSRTSSSARCRCSTPSGRRAG